MHDVRGQQWAERTIEWEGNSSYRGAMGAHAKEEGTRHDEQGESWAGQVSAEYQGGGGEDSKAYGMEEVKRRDGRRDEGEIVEVRSSRGPRR